MFSLKNFRSYQLSIQFYRQCENLRLPPHLRDQLHRSSSSIALNLGEGCSRPSTKERLRFYTIAFGSLREVQTILALAKPSEQVTTLAVQADILAAILHKLIYNQKNPTP